MGLGELTRQASGYLRDKYQTAKLFLTDVSPAESLAEEAINGDSVGLDPRTMMKISEAAFDVEDYWRIVDVLHRRLYRVDWKEWRQAYKALSLLEFLLTHGPEEMGDHFLCDLDVVQELGTFEHIDDRGFDWGSTMRRKSETVAKLLTNERLLREARRKALRISKDIQGFGSNSSSPASSPNFSSSSNKTSRSSSFGSSSVASSINNNNNNEQHSTTSTPRGHHDRSLQELARRLTASTTLHAVDDGEEEVEETAAAHSWVDTARSETGSLILDAVDEEGGGDDERRSSTSAAAAGARAGFLFRSVSNVDRVAKKKVERQLSSAF